MRRVFLTGATGLVGSAVAEALVRRGDRPVALSRRAAAASASLPAGTDIVEGDPAVAGAWQARLAGCDAVVHLAGEPVIGRRWNPEQKERIRRSRVDSTKLVAEAIAAAPAAARPAVLVNASAVGWYGLRRDEPCREDAASGDDFLAQLCVDWEAEARRAPTRVVLLRVGVVLSAEGGALTKMLPPFRMGVGGPIGDGRQWTPWVHLADLTAAILFALDDPGVKGPVNGVAPNPVTNAELTRTLAKTLHRPSLLRVPKLAVRVLFGEVAEVMLGGQNAVPAALLQSGFRFRFPRLPEALADVLGR